MPGGLDSSGYSSMRLLECVAHSGMRVAVCLVPAVRRPGAEAPACLPVICVCSRNPQFKFSL